MPMSRRFALLLTAALLALLLAGCGGGGGGKSGGGSILYRTLWGSGAGPAGVSERIQLFTASGQLVDSKILDQAGASGQVSFTGLQDGTYLLFAELNSGANFSGTTTGEVSVMLTVSGATTFTTQVGADPTAIQVSPTSGTFTVQQSFQFAATPIDSSGNAVFVAPGTFSWNVNGGVATVDSDGTVLGTNEGTGSVVATYIPKNFTDAAVLHVSAFNTQTSKWTVLVYLNAANDLDEFGDLNVNQMERAAGNANVRFVVQWKQANIPGVSSSPSFVGTRRYLLQHDTTAQINSTLIQDMGTGVDMGDWHTLHDFIQWGQTYFPSDRTVLVIWNHGNGWHRSLPSRGVSYDDDTGNWIDTWELQSAMGASHVDILAWDASLMQMVEVDDEIRTSADLFVGSEESPPGAGYPYDTIFQHFVDTPTAPTLTLAKAFVDETLAVPSYATQKITQSVIDGTQLSNLSAAIDQLAQALIAEKTLNPAGFDLYVQTARLNAQIYSQSSTRTYRDLIGLTLELDKTVGSYTPSAAILAGDQAVRTAAAAAILYEGHNAQSPKSNGISIDFSPNDRFANYAADYALLRFAQETNWNEWLSVAP